MSNKYQKGTRKEYQICTKIAKEFGYQTASEANKDNKVFIFRSAGSHSPFDVIVIDTTQRIIRLIQSKRTLSENMSYLDPQLSNKLNKQYSCINGVYSVLFDVL